MGIFDNFRMHKKEKPAQKSYGGSVALSSVARQAMAATNEVHGKLALDGIDDERQLAEIARSAELPEIRVAAAGKVHDDALMAEIIADERNATLRSRMISGLGDDKLIPVLKMTKDRQLVKEALAYLSSETAIAAYVVQIAGNYAEREAALKRIGDEKVIVEIALNSKYALIGKLALDRISSPDALKLICEQSADADLRQGALEKLRFAGISMSVQQPETEEIAELTEEVILKAVLRYLGDKFRYHEILNGWKLFYHADLYQELAEKNEVDYLSYRLLDGVRILPPRPEVYGIALNVRYEIVCPKCRKMFERESYVDGGAGSESVKCTHCGFWYDLAYTGSKPYYYLYAYTNVSRPINIQEVPKPSIFVKDISKY